MHRVSVYLVLAGLCVLGAIASIAFGAGDLHDSAVRSALLDLRTYRLVSAFLVGATLATGGVMVQGLFRNPLVCPSVLGTTSGATLGGQLAILGINALPATASTMIAPEMVMPFGCLAGALVALAALLAVARASSDPLVFLLVGFILSSLFLAVGGFVTSLAQDTWELGRAVVNFTLGDLNGVGRRQVALAAPLAVGGITAAWLWGRPLDLLLSGEEEATSLGVDVRRARVWGVAWTAVLTAAAVSLGGNVAFVGLIVPHVLRPFLGESHRLLVPAAALAGGAFVIACDLLVRLMHGQTEVPLGVITGLVGAPLFLVLVLRSQREIAHG